jgi:hypothetical protein
VSDQDRDEGLTATITQEDICWQGCSPGRPEDFHRLDELVFEMPADDVRSYTIGLREDLKSLRLICVEVVHQHSVLLRRFTTIQIENRRLRDEIRALREHVRSNEAL